MKDAIDRKNKYSYEEMREVVHPKKIESHGYMHSMPHHYDHYRLNEILSSDDSGEFNYLDYSEISSDDYYVNGQIEDKLKTKKSKKKKGKQGEAQRQKVQEEEKK